MNNHWGDLATAKTLERGPLCVGIDPAWENIPNSFKQDNLSRCEALRNYCRFMIEHVGNLVGFIKPQSAYFEAYGSEGLKVLSEIIKLAKSRSLLVVLDAKRGDIGATSEAYANAYLNPTSGSDLEVDCMTVNPFLGPETVMPFIDVANKFGKGLIILARTSNADAGWIQDIPCQNGNVSTKISEFICREASKNTGDAGVSNIGAVVGATYSEEAGNLRSLMPNSIFLMPGIGAQGGSSEALKNGYIDAQSRTGVIVPVSRGVTCVEDPNISEALYRETIIKRIQNLNATLRLH